MTLGYVLISIFLGILLTIKTIQSIIRTFSNNRKKSQYDDMMYSLASAGGHLFSTLLSVFFYVFEKGSREFLHVIKISIYVQFGFSVLLMILFITLTFSVLIHDYKERIGA